MNLKTWAKENGHTIAEAKEITGLTHWNHTVPESCDEIPEVPEDAVIETIDEGEKTVIETKSKEDPAEGVDPEVVELSIRCLGTKSQYWNK